MQSRGPCSLQQAVLEDALAAQALADLPEEGEDGAVLGALALCEDEDERDARVDLAKDVYFTIL